MILALFLLVVPVLAGSIFARTDRGSGSLLFRWVSGQFLLWMGFQLICVPLILRERSFGNVSALFLGYTAALALLASAAEIRRLARGASLPAWSLGRFFRGRQPVEAVLWLLFWGLFLFQMVQAVRLAYADGDDAYYVAVSVLTEESGTMYQRIPYTGLTTGLDTRHSLAPFPLWISFLSRVSGMRTVSVAQVVLPLVLIAMAYAVFGLLGRRLFPEKGWKLPLFMLFVELGVIFGDYSIYTVENFMIARSRQGKAALGSIVLPFLFLVLLGLLKKLQEKEKIPPSMYLLLGAAAVSACLCSTLGALIVCMGVGIVGILGAVSYKRPGVLAPMALSCLPCVCYALLYLFLEG